MTGHSEGPEPDLPATTAEDLFAHYLTAVAVGEAGDFEDFKARHPAWSKELDDLWVQRLRLQLALAAFARSARSLSAGASNDRGVEPDSPALPGLSEARLDELLRLSNRDKEARYADRELIGSGGMGEVYRVWDRVLQRHVAMKVIRGHDISGASAEVSVASRRRVARFEREARVLGSLDHPGIVAIHDLGFDDAGRIFFTMPVIAGRHFGEILQEAATRPDDWPLARLLDVLLKVCDAVACAHSQSIVHRDLKPANIMVGRFGETYVMDWGLARSLEPDDEREFAAGGVAAPDQAAPDGAGLTHRGQAIGTPAYMSPEQAAAHARMVGPESDIYSLGAILYHILVGHPPYLPPGSTPTPLEIVERVREGPPPLAEAGGGEGAPAELVAVCRKAMERDLKSRYAHVIDLANDLRAYAEGRRGSVWRDSVPVAIRKWAKRHPVRAIAVASFTATLLLGAGIVLLWQRNRGSLERMRRAEDAASAPLLVTRLEALARSKDLSPALNPNSPAAVPAEHPAAVARDDAAVALSRNFIAAFAGFGIGFREDETEAAASVARWQAIPDAGLRRRALDGAYELAAALMHCGAAYAASSADTEQPPWATEDDVKRWQSVKLAAPDLVAAWPYVKATIDALDVEPWRQRTWRAALAYWFERADQFSELLTTAPTLDLEADDLTRLYELARDAGHSGPEISELLMSAVRKDPGNFVAHFWLGGLAGNDKPARLEHQRIAVAVKPDSGAARYELGWTLQNIGEQDDRDVRESIDNYRSAISLEPTLAAAYINVSLLLPADDGVRCLEDALRLAPPSEYVYLNLAVLHAQLGPGFGEAARVAKAGTEQFPQSARLWFNLSYYLGESQDPDGEIEALREAIRAQPDLWQALVNLSVCLVKRAGDLSEDSEEAAGLRREAHELVMRANDVRDEDPERLYKVGCVLFDVKELALAVKNLIEASKAGHQDALTAIQTVREALPDGPHADELRTLIDAALAPPAISVPAK